MIPLRTIQGDKYEPLKTKETKYTQTGIPSLDKAINGFESKTVTIVTGRPSEGKSTFIHNALLDAIENGQKVLLIDGEHNKDDLYNSLFRKVIGADPKLYERIQCNRKVRVEPKQHIQEQLEKWFGTRLMIAFKHEMQVRTFDDMFHIIEGYCKASKIDLVICDNLMSLVSSTQAELNAKQSDFMKHCSSLAKSANVAVVLLAHPNQSAQKGKKIDYYQISGTSDLPNLADVVIQIVKDPLNDDDEKICDGMAYVLKNRKYSEYPEIPLGFDRELMALCEIRQGELLSKTYDWRMEGEQSWMDQPVPF